MHLHWAVSVFVFALFCLCLVPELSQAKTKPLLGPFTTEAIDNRFRLPVETGNGVPRNRDAELTEHQEEVKDRKNILRTVKKRPNKSKQNFMLKHILEKQRNSSALSQDIDGSWIDNVLKKHAKLSQVTRNDVTYDYNAASGGSSKNKKSGGERALESGSLDKESKDAPLDALGLNAQQPKPRSDTRTAANAKTPVRPAESKSFKPVWLSSTSGYLQSPGWGSGKNYPKGLDVTTMIVVPSGNVAMVSVQYLNLLFDHANRNDNSSCCLDHYTNRKLNRDRLTLSLRGSPSKGEIAWTACRTDRPLPDIYPTDHVMEFHFATGNVVYDSGAYATGFKILFSFHEAPNEVPEKASSSTASLWKCDVPFWEAFKHHFHCNSVPECQDGRDEEGCLGDKGHGLKIHSVHTLPGTNNPCAAGSAGTRCPDLKAICASRGQVPAVMNTPLRWAEGMTALRKGRESKVLLGLRWDSETVNAMYPRLSLYDGLGYWSADDSTAFFVKDVRRFDNRVCSLYDKERPNEVQQADCDSDLKGPVDVLCQDNAFFVQYDLLAPVISRKEGIVDVRKQSRMVKCPNRHYVHSLFACEANCYGKGSPQDGQAKTPRYPSGGPIPRLPPVCRPPFSPPPSFLCDDGVQRIPYSLLCDLHEDCQDASDETGCSWPQCQRHQFSCLNSQCIDQGQWCDGIPHCQDGSDERTRECEYSSSPTRLILPPVLNTLIPPVVVDADRNGRLTIRALGKKLTKKHLGDVKVLNELLAKGTNDFFSCPAETHFKCSFYCLPVYLRCNGMKDCPNGEDEVSCQSFQCPGYYRCRSQPNSRALTPAVCVHWNHVCDNIVQCPLADDEYMCDFECPASCTCHGWAFTCTGTFQVSKYPDLRYLKAPSTGINIDDLGELNLLTYLNLAYNKISWFPYTKFRNLRHLDLGYNKIKRFSMEVLQNFPSLKYLSLRNNPLVFMPGDASSSPIHMLQYLDLSLVWISELDSSSLASLPRLEVLNMSYSGIEKITGNQLRALKNLRRLDLRGCPMQEFTPETFKGLVKLEEVYGSNNKLCCPSNFADSQNLRTCYVLGYDKSPSCQTLLSPSYYKVFLVLFALLAILGNAGALVYRLFINKQETSHSCGVMVTHLCASDLLMGVYLVIIGSADVMYGEAYYLKRDSWSGSATCKGAGFVSLLSSEVSAFFICLMTLDRILVFRFPASGLRFRKSSAQLICWLIWVVGLFLAAVPLIETHWRFYGHSDTCLPLPTDKESFDGKDYSFGILIMLNFVLFFVIAAGQAYIYYYLNSGRKTLGARSKPDTVDRAISRRLIAIAMTDFLCWFPVCFVGFMASHEIPLPSHINTALSILVLPINSAINPFIYTFSMFLEERSARKDQATSVEKSCMI